MNFKPLFFVIAMTPCISLGAFNQPAAATSEPEQSEKQITQEKPDPDRQKMQRSFALTAMIELRLGESINRINDRVVPLEHQQIIYEILAKTSEVAIHQMRGEHENKVYIKETGEEVVFDQDGDPVKNGYNDGTFNYAFYKDEPLLHFILDISPWITMGISEQDPTDAKERIYAYMGDLENGIKRAREAAPFEPLPASHQWKKLGQIQALAVFAKVIEAGDAGELYELVNQDEKISDDQIIRVLTKLNRGFDIVYGVQEIESL